MKLIDLLVQELPKRGGWPDGVVKIHQDYDGETWGWLVHDDTELLFTLDQVAANAMKYGKKEKCENMVTREQYESALAASQKPAWSGEDLPPVGCECEWRDSNVGWIPVKIKYISEQIVVIESPVNLFGVQKLTEIAKDIICDKPQFRPLRTEADKKRERICDAIYGALTKAERQHNRSDEAEAVYDAIAAGKIPGVRLED